MIVERVLPFDHQLSCTIIDYHQLSFSLSLFKFFMIVNDSFSRLTTSMIVHDSFLVSCFGNHWPDSGQKTCCRPLSSQKIHTFTSVSHHLKTKIYKNRKKIVVFLVNSLIRSNNRISCNNLLTLSRNQSIPEILVEKKKKQQHSSVSKFKSRVKVKISTRLAEGFLNKR